MLAGEVEVRQRFAHALGVHVSGRVQFHLAQLAFYVLDLGKGGLTIFLGVGGLEEGGHRGELAAGHLREHVPEEVHRAALPLGVREDLRDGFQEAQVLVRGEQAHTLQAALLQAFQERFPALLALARAFRRAEDFAVAVAVHAYGHKHRHAGHFAAPAALQVDAVHEHVGVFAGERPVAPLLDLAVHLLVQVADGGCAHAGTPQELGDVLHAAHGYARKVHLDERFLHGRFPAPVALYDGRLERGQAQFRYGDVELSRAREEFPVVVAAAVVPAAFGAFVLLGIAEACRLLVQHRVERVLDSAPDERFQVVLESGFVYFDYISFHRMVLFSLICGYFKSKNWNILFFLPP